MSSFRLFLASVRDEHGATHYMINELSELDTDIPSFLFTGCSELGFLDGRVSVPLTETKMSNIIPSHPSHLEDPYNSTLNRITKRANAYEDS